MFDVLTYEKGAAVLRMLEQYLGEDVIRDGIRHYLARHAYGNTETDRPVGRHRGGRAASPCAASWTPGSSRAATRSSASSWSATAPRCGCTRSGSARRRRATRRRDRRRRRRAAADAGRAVGGAGRAALRVRRQHPDRAGAARRRPRPSSSSTFAPEWVVANAERQRLLPRPLLAEAARRPGRPAARRCCRRSSATGSSTTPTPRSWPARPSAPDFLDFARSFTEETELEVWQRLAAALELAGPDRRRRRPGPGSRPRCAAWPGRR